MRVVITQQQHAVDVVAKRIDQPTATAVCTVLRAQHIPVIAAVAFDGSLHLHPQRVLTTPEEVSMFRAFTACSDVRIIPHWAVS